MAQKYLFIAILCVKMSSVNKALVEQSTFNELLLINVEQYYDSVKLAKSNFAKNGNNFATLNASAFQTRGRFHQHFTNCFCANIISNANCKQIKALQKHFCIKYEYIKLLLNLTPEATSTPIKLDFS
jgi:hypothetical protein